MSKLPDIIFSDSISEIGSGQYEEYLAHAICLGGKCKFKFNGMRR